MWYWLLLRTQELPSEGIGSLRIFTHESLEGMLKRLFNGVGILEDYSQLIA
jgi:hypothetical protein